MTKLLNDQVVAQIKELFDKQLKEPVQLLFFGKEHECQLCSETRQLAEEVTSITDKLSLSIYDVEKDAEIAGQYHVDKAPTLVLAGKDDDRVVDYGVRLLGIPAGHEFSTFIHDIVLVSGRDSGLSREARSELKHLSKPVHLQVFVTPT